MNRIVTSSCCVLLLLSCLCAAQTSASAQGMSSKSPASTEKIWSDLMAGNQRFVSGHSEIADVPALRAKLATSQQPQVMVLSCSDSRVPPEQVFDKSLGDLFVVRSAGNIADPVGLGSLEYSYKHLGSTVLVIMGHTQCGAVQAACSGERMPTSNLQAIVDKIDPAVKIAKKGGQSGDQLLAAAIHDNVLQVEKDVLAQSEVLRHAVDEGKLTIIPALYSLETGNVSRLDASK